MTIFPIDPFRSQTNTVSAVLTGVTENTPIGVVSWGPDRIDVFGLGTDDAMYHLAWDGHAWSEWEARGGKFHSPPAVVSWGPDRIDVFGLGTDDAMYHLAWDGQAWSEWEPRGGKFHNP